MPHLVKAGRVKEKMTEEKQQWVQKLIALYQEKMSFGAEILSYRIFFKDEIEYDEEAQGSYLLKNKFQKCLQHFART